MAHVGAEVFVNYLVAEDGTGLVLNACGGLTPAEEAAIASCAFGYSVIRPLRTTCNHVHELRLGELFPGYRGLATHGVMMTMRE